MSLTEKRTSVAAQEPARPPREGRTRLLGASLAAAGLLLMWPAVTDALSASERGSGADDTLHGTSHGEEIVTFGGADELYGGPGRDALLAGGGDDFVEASDGERDLVLCGEGDDTASADRDDFISQDCETVYAN